VRESTPSRCAWTLSASHAGPLIGDSHGFERLRRRPGQSVRYPSAPGHGLVADFRGIADTTDMPTCGDPWPRPIHTISKRSGGAPRRAPNILPTPSRTVHSGVGSQTENTMARFSPETPGSATACRSPPRAVAAVCTAGARLCLRLPQLHPITLGSRRLRTPATPRVSPMILSPTWQRR
jgi:hypothetical protein